MYQNKKVVRPAPTVKYKESRREEIRFDDTDADWDVLNEAIAIAKREAVELDLRTTKEREDEEETICLWRRAELLEKQKDSTALNEFRKTFDLDVTHQKAIFKIDEEQNIGRLLEVCLHL